MAKNDEQPQVTAEDLQKQLDEMTAQFEANKTAKEEAEAKIQAAEDAKTEAEAKVAAAEAKAIEDAKSIETATAIVNDQQTKLNAIAKRVVAEPKSKEEFGNMTIVTY